MEYLALPVSSGRFPQAIHVLRYSRIAIKKIFYFRILGYYHLGLCFPANSPNKIFCNFFDINHIATLQPPTWERIGHRSILSVPKSGLGFFAFARRYLRNTICFFSSRYWNVLLPWVCTLAKVPKFLSKTEGFPHSEISGSKVARYLTEAYRNYATSFIASYKSRHPPYALTFLLGNVKTTILICLHL